MKTLLFVIDAVLLSHRDKRWVTFWPLLGYPPFYLPLSTGCVVPPMHPTCPQGLPVLRHTSPQLPAPLSTSSSRSPGDEALVEHPLDPVRHPQALQIQAPTVQLLPMQAQGLRSNNGPVTDDNHRQALIQLRRQHILHQRHTPHKQRLWRMTCGASPVRDTRSTQHHVGDAHHPVEPLQWGWVEGGGISAGDNFGEGDHFAGLASPKAFTASRTHCTAKAPRSHENFPRNYHPPPPPPCRAIRGSLAGGKGPKGRCETRTRAHQSLNPPQTGPPEQTPHGQARHRGMRVPLAELGGIPLPPQVPPEAPRARRTRFFGLMPRRTPQDLCCWGGRGSLRPPAPPEARQSDTGAGA